MPAEYSCCSHRIFLFESLWVSFGLCSLKSSLWGSTWCWNISAFLTENYLPCYFLLLFGGYFRLDSYYNWHIWFPHILRNLWDITARQCSESEYRSLVVRKHTYKNLLMKSIWRTAMNNKCFQGKSYSLRFWVKFPDGFSVAFLTSARYGSGSFFARRTSSSSS